MKMQSLSFRGSFSSLWQSAVFRGVCQLVWSGGVLLLPITSLPLLIELSGATTVAPPSVPLFLALTLIWLAPLLIRGGKIPAESKPLLAYLGVVGVSLLLSFFVAVPPFRDQNPLTESRQAMATLGMAMTAYFIAATWPATSHKNLRYTFQLINLSGLLLIAWSLLQAVYVFVYNNRYPETLQLIQETLSSRHNPLFFDRVTGFAYEPSWLAHQLNMVFLPIWLSATLQGYSVHRFKLWRISIENILLVSGVVVLFVSFSRVGILAFLLVIAYLAMKGNWILARRIQVSLATRLIPRLSLQPLVRAGILVALLVSFFFIYIAGAAGLFIAGARFEPRWARILEGNPLAAGGFFEITNQLAFAERVIYWATGWEVFNDHPWFGVGLGKAGFYFEENMPAFGWALWEVSQLFYYESHVPNTKSLWVRILAESGIVGFSVFLAWCFLLWQSARLARSGQALLLKTAGLAGQLVLVGFLVEGFSLDSFALPYVWFSLGLLSSASFLARQELIESAGNG